MTEQTEKSSLKNDILKALGFTYGNPDVSAICTLQLRDDILAVVDKHEKLSTCVPIEKLEELFIWIRGYDRNCTECNKQLQAKKKSLGLGSDETVCTWI